jgi:hypothetical protein
VHVIVPFIKQYVELKETYKIKEKVLQWKTFYYQQ